MFCEKNIGSDNMKKNVIGYIRVSTETQVKNGQGLDIQRDEIIKYCKENNLNLVDIYVDAGISGSNSIDERDGLSDLLIECQNRNKHIIDKNYSQKELNEIFSKPNNYISSIIVQKMDRLARDTYVYLWVENKLREMGVEVISINEEMFCNSNTDPVMQALKEMVIVFAKMEKGIIANRMSKGRNKKASQGKKPCGKLPYGYDYNSDKDIVINPDEAKVVNKIFKLASQNISCTNIATKLNKNGLTTKRGKPWSRQSIKVIIDNDFYISILTYKEKIQGNHPSIISKELWNKVHEQTNK